VPFHPWLLIDTADARILVPAIDAANQADKLELFTAPL
jgi:hypothetical protein